MVVVGVVVVVTRPATTIQAPAVATAIATAAEQLSFHLHDIVNSFNVTNHLIMTQTCVKYDYVAWRFRSFVRSFYFDLFYFSFRLFFLWAQGNFTWRIYGWRFALSGRTRNSINGQRSHYICATMSSFDIGLIHMTTSCEFFFLLLFVVPILVAVTHTSWSARLIFLTSFVSYLFFICTCRTSRTVVITQKIKPTHAHKQPSVTCSHVRVCVFTCACAFAMHTHNCNLKIGQEDSST